MLNQGCWGLGAGWSDWMHIDRIPVRSLLRARSRYINEAIVTSSANEEKRERRVIGGHSKLIAFDVLHPDFSTGCERIAPSAQQLRIMSASDVNNINQQRWFGTLQKAELFRIITLQRCSMLLSSSNTYTQIICSSNGIKIQ